MSDPTPQPGAEANPATDPVTPEAKPDDKPAEGKTFDEAYVKQLRDEAAGYRTKLKAIEDEKKTDEQRKDELIAELQSKVTGFETKEQVAEWKAEVAKATGVSAAALAGSTKEEIEAHAEILKPLIAPTDPPATLPVVIGGRDSLPLNGNGIEDVIRDALSG